MDSRSVNPQSAIRNPQLLYIKEAGLPILNGAVLFGAARLGARLLQTCKKHGVRVAAFADNNRALWGKTLEGLPIRSPDELAKEPESIVIVASMSVREIVPQLRALGSKKIIPHFVLSAAFPEVFPNPFYDGGLEAVCASADKIEQLRKRLADDKSRSLFDRLLRFRESLAVEDMPVAEPNEYFPDDLPALGADESFADCGAYDGDTLRAFLEKTGGKFKNYYAFEPDPASFVRLKASVPPTLSGQIALFQAGVGAHVARMRFDPSGAEDASFCESGGIEADVVSLDEALREKPVSMIKMDVEGYEPEALHGAEEIIRRQKPRLAVCVYHRPSHLWELPLEILRLNPGYQLYLRHHEKELYGTVCYAFDKPAS